VGYLVAGGGPDVRFQLSPNRSLEHFDQLQNGKGTFGREVDRLAAQCRVLGDRLSKLQVGEHSVNHVEIVPGHRPVRADHWTLALEQETYRARDEPLPVRISRTEEIAAPRYDDGQGVDTSEALGDEVRARLGHIVRTNSEERHIFRIGEDGLLSGGIATAEQRRLPSPHDGR
jgi:hypothetical protein